MRLGVSPDATGIVTLVLTDGTRVDLAPGWEYDVEQDHCGRFVSVKLAPPEEPMSHYDSTGKSIRVGDRVRWRGQNYTIKAFTDQCDPTFGTPILEFEEPLHLTDEQPNETSVDLL